MLSTNTTDKDHFGIRISDTAPILPAFQKILPSTSGHLVSIQVYQPPFHLQSNLLFSISFIFDQPLELKKTYTEPRIMGFPAIGSML